ncbi:glycoside hydrolase [Paenibacillus selenitireducens]|uniref:chitinase n=1 Tax=Paenibacillus selenitireducens TaxID=1324314 RepID=A0A1T2X306_9BACL|nr:glycosyl hydrolase family 18 protein [Paenibacillus selenitireducens]OPA74242.1 glycoside hydrolase [Paenibacillus selenitireducens]
MRKAVRKKSSHIMTLLLSFALVFGTLFSPTTYAADNTGAEISSETNTAENTITPQPTDPSSSVISSTYGDPLAPQNLRVLQDSITNTSATIQWDKDPVKNDIEVWLAEDDKYFTWGNSGSRTLDNLKPETTYKLYITWLVRPVNLEHKSNVIEFTTLGGEVVDPFINPPQNLRIENVTHNVATLVWDFIPNKPNDMQVYNADTGAWLAWGNSTTRKITGLQPETKYRIFIVWEKDKQNTGKDIPEDRRSNVLEFTTTKNMEIYEEAPLSPPSYLKIKDVTEDSVTLSWGGSAGANGYDLYANNQWITGIWDGTNQVTYPIPAGTVTGAVYSFMVGAQYAAPGEAAKVSAKSNKVTMKWGELAAPTDLQAVTATRTSVALGWGPTPGATSYEIYQDGQRIGSSDSNRYLVDGLTEGRSYSFKVVAQNSLWTSPESVEAKIVPGSNYNIVTYYTSWSLSEEGRNYKPTDIDVNQVTHINYAFTDLCWQKIGTNGKDCKNVDLPLQNKYVFDGEMIIGDPDFDLKNLQSFAEIKQSHPKLKVLVSVGGWSWSRNFSNMAADEVTRHAFANSVVKFLRQYQLDGIDIDWEYPVEGGEESNSRGPQDKENFTLLMQTVREALDAAGSEDGKYYLQTIAAAQGDNFVVNADLANSSKYLDFINMMTYDYSGSWEKLAHHNAPLYFDKNHPKAATTAPRNNVEGAAQSFVKGGVPNYKVVVGVPFYGKGWAGCPATGNGQYQECSGGTAFGTWESGIFDFQDLENNYINKNGYIRYWNEASKVAYVYNPDTKVFITYNDKETMAYTAAMLKSLDLAGVMSWEVHGDKNKTLSTQLLKDLPIDGTVNASAIKAPQNLATTSTGVNTIQLKWDASAGATGYEVYVNKQWVANTTDTQYKLTSLNANTNYAIHVIAVVKSSEGVQEVSVNSPVLNVKTQADTVTPTNPPTTTSPSPSPGTPTPTQPSTPKDQLETQIKKDGDKLTVTLPKDAALKAINQSASSSFKINITDVAKQVEISLPKEVIEAIAKKGEKASLTLIVNGVEHIIPIHSIHGSTDVKISIQSPAQDTLDKISKLVQGAKVRVSAFEVKIEMLHADKTTKLITDFGAKGLSRKFTFKAKDIDIQRATGVVYLPDTNEIRSVPTVITVNGDGTVTVELKRQGNGIYAIIETNVNNFKDVTAGWAQKDVAQAVAKLIAFGEKEDQFGANTYITRAEVASVIVRALGILPDGSSAGFTDVDAGSKYEREIAAAKKAGLIQGMTLSTFDPDAPVTREQLAVILTHALKSVGIEGAANTASLERYNDQANISAYAKSALATLVELKILLGVSDTQLSPQSHVTKAQAAVTIMRTLRASGLSN